MNEKHLPKTHIFLKYKERFPVSLDYFKELILAPESKTQEFLLFYEFTLMYNKCLNLELAPIFEKILTKSEIQATSFSVFIDVFKERAILNSVSIPRDQKADPNVLQSSGYELSSFFLSEVYKLFNSSAFGHFSKYALEDKFPQISKLNESFFAALKCKDYSLFLQKIHLFEVNYNLCLVETLKMWYIRQSMVSCFFELKNFPMARFYLLVSLIHLDQKMRSSLTMIKTVNFHIKMLEDQAEGLLEQSKKTIPTFQEFKKLLTELEGEIGV